MKYVAGIVMIALLGCVPKNVTNDAIEPDIAIPYTVEETLTRKDLMLSALLAIVKRRIDEQSNDKN